MDQGHPNQPYNRNKVETKKGHWQCQHNHRNRKQKIERDVMHAI